MSYFKIIEPRKKPRGSDYPKVSYVFDVLQGVWVKIFFCGGKALFFKRCKQFGIYGLKQGKHC